MRTQQGRALFWICLTGILNKGTGGKKKINRTPTHILIPHLNRRRDHGRGPTYEGMTSGEQSLSTSRGAETPSPMASVWQQDPEDCLESRAGSCQKC